MERQSNWYTFAGTTVPAAGDITGKIDNVWNNDGDASYLYDSSGRLVKSEERMIMNVTVDRLKRDRDPPGAA